MKGFINLLKPQGMSSAYAVGAVKHVFNTACGHMGTLDPMASGVLPVGLSKTSRLFQYLLNKRKTYVARFKFGFSTDTLDVTGTIIQSGGRVPCAEEISVAVSSFVGTIDQVPPKYSAKCVDGKRGYQLSRKGVDFTLPPKSVEVFSYRLLSQTDTDEYEFEIECGGGTYIRALARDLGVSLGTSATMSALKRTACGVFTEANGVSVEELKSSADPEKFIIPADCAVDFPKVALSDKQATRILNGLFDNYGLADGLYRVYNGEEFWGVGKSEDGVLKITSYVR